MGGKMEISKSFRMDELFADWLSRQIFELDCDLATLVRTSLILAVPLIRDCPSFLDGRVTLSDFQSQQNNRQPNVRRGETS